MYVLFPVHVVQYMYMYVCCVYYMYVCVCVLPSPPLPSPLVVFKKLTALVTCIIV